MALDPRIAMGVQPIQIESPINRLAQVMQLQGAQQQNALTGFQLKEAQAGAQEREALRNYLARPGLNLDDAETQRGLYGVAPTQAANILKGRLDIKKTQGEIDRQAADTAKSKAETATKALEAHRGLLTMVQTPEHFGAWVDSMFANPATAEIAKQFGTPEVIKARIPADPTQFQQFIRMNAIGMDNFIKDETSRRGQDLTDKRTREEGAANRSVTMRGQNMTDARSRENAQATRELAQATRAEKAEQKRVENVDKEVTKFSNTIQKEGIPELETALSDAEGAIRRYPKGKVPGVGRLEGAIPAFALGAEGNDVRQAVATVRNIVLNARSGAAVTDQELRRLVEELGTGIGQSEEALVRGLGRVRARLDKIKENAAAGVSDDVLNVYTERGGIPLKRGSSAPGKPTPPASDPLGIR